MEYSVNEICKTMANNIAVVFIMQANSLIQMGDFMLKINVPVSVCRKGDIVAVDVYSEQGVLLVAKGTVIDKLVKSSLKNMGVTHIWILGNIEEGKLNKGKNRINRFLINYKYKIGALEDIFKHLSAGENVDMEQLDALSDCIYDEINECQYLACFLNKIKGYDDYTFTHCLNVSFYSALIGKWMKLSVDDLKKIIKSSLLHDIGKIEIPINILNKREKLSSDEVKLIKKHSLLGYDILTDIAGLETDIKLTVLLHHEREDGSGYPYNYRGQQLSLNTKIVSIADTYDALTSDRAYRKKVLPFEAFNILLSEGISIFDAKILNIFIRELSYCYIGAKVMLNSGDVGEIVYIPLHNITKPVVRIGSKIIDMAHEKGLYVTGMA